MRKNKKPFRLLNACIITIIIIQFFIIEACCNKVQASSFFLDTSKVVLIIADYFELQDFAQDEYLNSLMNNSSLGFISARQTGKASANKAKLTIGASKRLEIESCALDAVKLTESVDWLNYDLIIGEAENIMLKNIKTLKQKNTNSEYLTYIGYLGNTLRAANKKTGILGNSDTTVNNRGAILIPMNENGLVDVGDVDSSILYDLNFPGGKRTDFAKLLQLYDEYYKKADLLVIDTGDLSRLEFYQSKTNEEAYKTCKQITIERLSGFLKAIIHKNHRDVTYIVLSTYPSKMSIQAGFKLTPIIVYNQQSIGLLHSSSTKRNGIITSLDIADYIIQNLAGKGRNTLTTTTSTQPLNSQLLLKRQLLNISIMRLPVLSWYAIFEIVCAVAGFLYLINAGQKKNHRLLLLMKLIMLTNILAPAALLYIPIVGSRSVALYFVLLVSVSFATAWLLSLLFKNSMDQFAAAAIVVNSSLSIDILRNSVLMKNSVFGYDPIIGARFYGIGNEYAGVFIGSGLLLAGCVLERFRQTAQKKKKTTLALLSIYTMAELALIGLPFAGANFGATIAAVFGYFFFINTVTRSKINMKKLLLLCILVLAAVGIIILLDLSAPSNTTHIGRFVDDIKNNGVQVLISTLLRKAAMNLKLIKYTIWTKVLLCIILIITIMFFKPVKILRGIFKKYMALAAAWIGISAASIAGLIVNDSGIVMAATAMIFTGYTILYKCMEELE